MNLKFKELVGKVQTCVGSNYFDLCVQGPPLADMWKLSIGTFFNPSHSTMNNLKWNLKQLSMAFLYQQQI